jgi:hypothetical protein
VSKDRARPFSRKHRKYWIPVTGGMLLIGAINVLIGLCSYKGIPPEPQRIELTLPPPGTGTDGTVNLGEVPAPVMHAFAVAYPRHIATAKKLDGTTFELSYVDAGVTHRVTYRADGTELSSR